MFKDDVFEKTLVLSTAHMPESDPDFGSVRNIEHEYGFIAFVADKDLEENSPRWIVEVMNFARANDCSMVNFDRDASVDKNPFHL